MESMNYLPIGTVLLLKGGTKKVMITGFCVIANDNKHKLYDYSGCLYPEGVVNSNEVCLFNAEQIQKVYFKGYENEEESNFKNELTKALQEIQIDSDHNIIDEMSSIDADSNMENQAFVINNHPFDEK